MASAYDNLILAESALVHFWPLNDTVGSLTVADSKGSQSGAPNAGVTLGVAGIFPGDTETLASFDGGATADITFTNEAVNHAAWSIEFIVKLAGDPTALDFGFVRMYDDANGTAILNVHGSDGNLFGERVFSFNSSVNSIQSSAGNNVATATPYHVVLTNTGISSGTQLLYLNGAQVQTRTGNWNTLTGISAISFVKVTEVWTGNPVRVNGVMGKVAYYNDVISAARVTAHYNALASSFTYPQLERFQPRGLMRGVFAGF